MPLHCTSEELGCPHKMDCEHVTRDSRAEDKVLIPEETRKELLNRKGKARFLVCLCVAPICPVSESRSFSLETSGTSGSTVGGAEAHGD